MEKIKWFDTPSVYILYDREFNPLYVGKSIRLSDRLQSHFNDSSFKDDIAYIGVKQYETRADMDIAEILTIQEKDPEYNKDCNHGEKISQLQISGDVKEINLLLLDLPWNRSRKKEDKENEDDNTITFTVRGCNRNQHRDILWGQIADKQKNEEFNSYIQLKREPKNKFDPNAVLVLCRGEFYGTLGYIAREETYKYREILEQGKEIEEVLMANTNDVGNKEIQIVVKVS